MLLADRPHPFPAFARQGLSARDYLQFVLKKARDKAKLSYAADAIETAWRERNERLADDPDPAE
jgi:hypothetical protein